MNDEICKNQNFTESYIIYLENHTYNAEPALFRTLYFEDYIKILAYIVIIFGGLLGNISAILTVALNRSMRSTINIYVANLAVADAMICMFCMVPHILQTVTSPIYPLGEFMCKFNPFIQMTCLTSSVLTLSAISCDRFIAIMFPLHVRVTKKRTSVVMTVVWILSAFVSIPFIIVKKHKIVLWKNFIETKCVELWPEEWYYDERIGACDYYEPLRAPYYLVITITLFFLPVVIMVTAYSLLLWRLWIARVPGECHASHGDVHGRAKRKVLKMVFVVLLAFIFCWTPLQFIVLYSAYRHEKGEFPPWIPKMMWFSYYIAYANSFVNPIIYGFFNKTFREGFCIVLRCGLRTDRFPPRTVDNYGASNTFTGQNLYLKSVRYVHSTFSTFKSRMSDYNTRFTTRVPTYKVKVVKATEV